MCVRICGCRWHLSTAAMFVCGQTRVPTANSQHACRSTAPHCRPALCVLFLLRSHLLCFHTDRAHARSTGDLGPPISELSNSHLTFLIAPQSFPPNSHSLTQSFVLSQVEFVETCSRFAAVMQKLCRMDHSGTAAQM